MTYLLKRSKKALSFVLVFAIVAMSLFTGVSFSVNALQANCINRKTICWNGGESAIATGSGAVDDPYIIKTADELAWLVKQNADVTCGKYFEIDQEIGTIVLQPEAYANTVIDLADAAAVKTYFKSNAVNMKSWPNADLEQASFCGNFDGNGATIYGLYQATSGNAGLFSAVDAGATIKNVGLKNSYITSTATNCNVGAIAACTNDSGCGAKTTGKVYFDSCIVANNYITNPSVSYNSTGVVVGLSQDAVCVDNCLVYGNDATYGALGASTYVPTSQDAEWKSHPENYKLLAFTFDDGPSTNMARLIQLFSLYEGTGTFFVRGISIKGDISYQYMQSAIDAGWDLGNHGDKHLNAMTGGSGGGNATYDQIYADITNLTTKLESNLKTRDGESYNVRFYRPPYIKTTENSFKICTEQDLAVIWLKRDSYDWSGSKSYADRYAIMESGITTWKDGDIILCHEVDSMSEDTYKILVDLLPEFYEAGYRFCSISELMQMRGITQNQVSGKLENKNGNNSMVTNVLEVVRNKVAPLFGGNVSINEEFAESMVSDSIILDTPAFDYAQQQGESLNKPEYFENVITNVSFKKYLLSNGKIFAPTEEQIKVVADLNEEQLPSAFIKTDSMPELCSFHDDAIANGAEGHSISCSCGLVDSNVTPHSFANDCQLGCLVCGWTPNGHSYDNACDPDCNECGAARSTTHAYSNDCDTDCNVCGVTRNVPDHIYDDKYDADCNECGAIREVSPRDWQISVNATGVYSIKPNKTINGFNKDSITVYDKDGKVVKYNDAKQGWPLVANKEYTVGLNIDYGNANTLAWNLTKKADTIFTDTVSSENGGWYNDAVTYSVGAGLITGYGGTNLFGTADNIQRQDFVVILARLAGVDLDNYVSSGRYSFADVPKGAYYEKAIMWAADAGITTGYAGGTKFGVGDKITREQLVTFLYRYAKYANGGVAPVVSADAADKAAAYADFTAVTDYAQEAIIWALDKGIIKGQGGTHIAPGGNALRCEVAQIIYNIYLNDIL